MEILISDRDLFPDYEIIKVVEGAMGRIFFLRHKKEKERRVIAKTLRKELAYIPQYYKRFIEEAELSLSIEPFLFLAQPIALVTEHDQPYLLMHWIDGSTLYEWSQNSAKFDLPTSSTPVEWNLWWKSWNNSTTHPYHPASLLFYIYQICIGLEWLYNHGVNAHGDIHNMNIMISYGLPTSAILIDLGLAHAPELVKSDIIDNLPRGARNHVVGCLPYIAPELLRGKTKADYCTDIYALGVTMYSALTGHFPYSSRLSPNDLSMSSILYRQHMNTTQQELNHISKGYCDCVLRCFAFKPEDRYMSIIHLKDDIAAILKQDYCLTIEIKSETPSPAYLKNRDKFLINRAAAILEDTNRFSEAEAILQDILSRNPYHASALQVLALGYYNNQLYEEAEYAIDLAVNNDSEDFYALNTKGIISTALEKHEIAIEFLNRAVKASQNDAQRRIALLNLSIPLQRSKYEIESEQKIDESLKIGKGFRLLMKEADSEYDAGRWRTASDLCKQALKLNPIYLKAWDLLGSSLRKARCSEDAYQAYEHGLSIDPNDADILVGMAYAAAETGKSRAEILALLDRATIVGRNDKDVVYLQMLASEGEKAKYYAAKVLELDPQDKNAKHVLHNPHQAEVSESLGQISLDINRFLNNGFSREEILSCAEAMRRIIMTSQNLHIPLTKTVIEKILIDQNRTLLKLLITDYTTEMQKNNNPVFHELSELLKIVLQYISKGKEE